MSNHRTRVDTSGRDFFGVCDCKAFGPVERFRTLAEDWGREHLRAVERVRAHLQGRNPSIADQHAYYRRMQRDPRLPAQERALWKILADGLEHRVGITDRTQALF